MKSIANQLSANDPFSPPLDTPYPKSADSASQATDAHVDGNGMHYSSNECDRALDGVLEPDKSLGMAPTAIGSLTGDAATEGVADDQASTAGEAEFVPTGRPLPVSSPNADGPLSLSAPCDSTSASRAPNYVLANPDDPARWVHYDYRTALGLEPRIYAPPAGGSADYKRYVALEKKLNVLEAAIGTKQGSDAVSVVHHQIIQWYDPRNGKYKIKFPYLEGDVFDPGFKFFVCLSETAHVLHFGDFREPAVAMNERLAGLAAELLRFEEKHDTGVDARFGPIRGLRLLLGALALATTSKS